MHVARCKRNYSAGSSRKMLTSFKIFWREYAMLSGGVENTLSLRYTQRKKSQAVKSGDWGGRSMLWPNPIIWLFRNKASRWSLTSMSRWGGATSCIHQRPVSLPTIGCWSATPVPEEQARWAFKDKQSLLPFFEKVRTNNQPIPTECSPDGDLGMRLVHLIWMLSQTKPSNAVKSCTGNWERIAAGAYVWVVLRELSCSGNVPAAATIARLVVG